MERLSKLNLILIVLLIFLVGYISGGLTIISIKDLLYSLWQTISRNEIVASSILIVAGWYISSYFDRRLASRQFISDKKFIIAEILLKSLSKYSSSIISSTKLMTSFKINYNIPILNSDFVGSTIINDIYKEWLSTNQPYIEFLQNCENYEIVLKNIGSLLDVFKEKRKYIDSYFREQFLLSNKNYLGFQTNSVLREELIQLIRKAESVVFDHAAYIMDVRIGIQNRLLSKIFKNKVPLRKQSIEMEVIS